MSVTALDARVSPRDAAEAAALMGQSLYRPPSVKGWDGMRTWINAGTWVARHNTLTDLAQAHVESKDKLRVDHLKSVHSPMLFVQGDRDTLCNLDILRRERKRLHLPGALHVVPGGDHSYKQLAARRAAYLPEMNRAADIVKTFVDKVLAR